MWRRTGRSALLLLTIALPPVATRAAAQVTVAAATDSSSTLQGTTSSAAARAALDSALASTNNIHFERAVVELDHALAADSALGVARVLRAGLAPGLTDAQREEEGARGIADAADAPVGEMLVALAFREQTRGNPVTARRLFEAASELMPGDARVAYWAATTGVPAANASAALQTFTRKHPDYAPGYNILAYALMADGDSAGALRAVQEYVRLAPREPNPYDSYGEILQRMGRYDESAAQYRRSIEADSAFVEAYAGLAEAQLLAGKSDDAMASWRKAAERAAAPDAKLGFMDQLAIGRLYTGDAEGAEKQFAENARMAAQQGDSAAAALAHRRMAVVAGARGDRAGVDGHLRGAAAFGGAESQPQRMATTVARALVGDAAGADASARAFAESAHRAGNPNAEANARGLEALAAASAGDVARATAALDQAGDDPNARLARVLLADALEKTGDAAKATALREEAMAGGNVTMPDAVIHMRVRKR